MKFIKLTKIEELHNNIRESIIEFNFDRMESLEIGHDRDYIYTFVKTINGGFNVKETPDQIKTLIKKAEYAIEVTQNNTRGLLFIKLTVWSGDNNPPFKGQGCEDMWETIRINIDEIVQYQKNEEHGDYHESFANLTKMKMINMNRVRYVKESVKEMDKIMERKGIEIVHSSTTESLRSLRREN